MVNFADFITKITRFARAYMKWRMKCFLHVSLWKCLYLVKTRPGFRKTVAKSGMDTNFKNVIQRSSFSWRFYKSEHFFPLLQLALSLGLVISRETLKFREREFPKFSRDFPGIPGKCQKWQCLLYKNSKTSHFWEIMHLYDELQGFYTR